jgi:DNA-binding NtrC family response regulator
MKQRAVFIFERTAALRETLRELLLHCGHELSFASEKGGLLRLLESRHPDLVILGPSSVGPGNRLELAGEIHELRGTLQILLIVSNSSEELAIAALQAGVREYVKHPFAAGELLGAVNRCLGPVKEPLELPQRSMEEVSLEGIVGESFVMQEIRGRIARVASSDSNVLITGETGTGKELLAEAVHGKSPRRHKPLIAINCAAIPDSLLESELFGYAKGAFTGADSNSEGRLKAADKGTVFLDEIGDMSAYGQAKILRLIESKEIQRLGCNRGIPLDVRVIAATNQDLEQLSKENKFRKDLFFRLNVARIHLPPLRERKEDLLYLIDYYIGRFNRRFGRNVRGLSEEALDCLLAYDWPGNVRELKNLLESIFVEGSTQDISLADLPLQLRLRCNELKSLAGNERERLLWALSATNWNKSKAADKLHWSRMTLYRKMARYNISRAG